MVLAYTLDSRWRNRSEFLLGRDEIHAFLVRKWQRELDYVLRKDLWAFSDDRIAVRFQYEWHDQDGQWWRSYGNENWEFDEHGLMRRREASINDVAITAGGAAHRGTAGAGRPGIDPVALSGRAGPGVRTSAPVITHCAGQRHRTGATMDAVERRDERGNARVPLRDVAWRRRLLRSAGLPEELSRAVAASHGHDVNDLLGLLQLGCPPATALRITARDDRAPSA